MSIQAFGRRETDSVDSPKKKIVKINELQGRCTYFPLADYHNIRIFKNNKRVVTDVELKRDISNRLYMALLLFDKVIIHCSDPLRSPIILEILEENIGFVENGDILFVFSNSIDDIKEDFRRYIEEKINKYERNSFSSTDIDSLKQTHMTSEYYERVIEVLEKTPFILKKGKEGSSGFKELIQQDLDNNVEVAVMGRDNYARSHIRLMNLTLFQLMNLKYFDKNEIKDVFDSRKIQEFITTWESETDGGAPFSRHTIVEQLRKTFLEGNEKNQRQVISVIETRLSLLYSKLNCGNHQVIEFHPATEKRSVYNWRSFQLFLSEINENRKVQLTGDKVWEIRKLDAEWNQFRNEFLSCMAELEAKMTVSQQSEIKNMETDNALFMELLKKHYIAIKYLEIKKIL